MATDLIGVSIARSFVVFQRDSTPRYTIRRFAVTVLVDRFAKSGRVSIDLCSSRIVR